MQVNQLSQDENVVVGDGGREKEMEMVILQQDALIKVLQTQCWELLKKSSDDVQT